MRRDEFYIGLEFTIGDGTRFRCTDVGTRVVIAINLNGPEEVVEYDPETQVKTMPPVLPEERPTWHRGPPYAVVENFFDEYDLPGCEPVEDQPNSVLAQPAAMTQAERQRAFKFVDAELRRLDVQFIGFDGGVVEDLVRHTALAQMRGSRQTDWACADHDDG